MVQERLDLWIKTHIETLLKPLFDLEQAEEVEGIARGVAFRLTEGLGILERQEIADDIRQLDQQMRGSLRKLGVRFGAYHIYVPALLKPAPSQLLAQLWALKEGKGEIKGLTELPQLSASGRTSVPVDPEIEQALYRVVGFRVCGPRAVRVDILERLADIIRPLVAWKPLEEGVEPPEGALVEGGAFTVTVSMTSLLGCAGEDFSNILKSLGYRLETREEQRPVTKKPEAPAEEAEAAPAEQAAEGEAEAPAAAEVTEAPAEEAAPAEASEEATGEQEMERLPLKSGAQVVSVVVAATTTVSSATHAVAMNVVAVASVVVAATISSVAILASQAAKAVASTRTRTVAIRRSLLHAKTSQWIRILHSQR